MFINWWAPYARGCSVLVVAFCTPKLKARHTRWCLLILWLTELAKAPLGCSNRKKDKDCSTEKRHRGNTSWEKGEWDHVTFYQLLYAHTSGKENIPNLHYAWRNRKENLFGWFPRNFPLMWTEINQRPYPAVVPQLPLHSIAFFPCESCYVWFSVTDRFYFPGFQRW